MVQSILNENGSVRVGMFNLQDGSYVDQLNADNRKLVRAVIAFVDEDKRYAVGLCPVKIMLPFSFSCLNANTEGIFSGREATKVLLEEAAKQNIELPAIEFCLNYDKNGVTKGEAFLPSAAELNNLPKDTLKRAWHKIGMGDFSNTLLSSTVNAQSDVWVYSFSFAAVTGWCTQYRTCGLMPAIEIKF